VKAPTATSIVVFDANFTRPSVDLFSYSDDIFSTNQPKYAKGYNETTNDKRDVITVELGGVDDDTKFSMSGGWKRSFELSQKSDITITVVFQLQIDEDFEPEEYTEVLCSVDDKKVKNGSDNYLARLAGNGDGGSDMCIPFTPVDLLVKNLKVGSHTIAVGGFLSRKSQLTERSFIRFDRIRITSKASESGGD
jgi:hypothetical protein